MSADLKVRAAALEIAEKLRADSPTRQGVIDEYTIQLIVDTLVKHKIVEK